MHVLDPRLRVHVTAHVHDRPGPKCQKLLDKLGVTYLARGIDDHRRPLPLGSGPLVAKMSEASPARNVHRLGGRLLSSALAVAERMASVESSIPATVSREENGEEAASTVGIEEVRGPRVTVVPVRSRESGVPDVIGERSKNGVVV